ncbi:MAG: hypothetical protein ACM362_11235, partial [Candidatus Methylomirabilota bacterium]
ECRRVLKDTGLLVFTFHHKASEAWANVLKAVLEAGFFIAAAYPVHSEMPLSVHIHRNQAISCDAILVCRKRERSMSVTGEDRLSRSKQPSRAPKKWQEGRLMDAAPAGREMPSSVGARRQGGGT